MKDTHEANLPTEENGKLEETKAPETTPENTAEEVVTNEVVKYKYIRIIPLYLL